MKLLFIKLKVFAIACSLIFPESTGKDSNTFPGPHKISYVIMISNRQEEHQARVLIKSIREFGGEFSTGPVIVVLSNNLDSLGSSLGGTADKIINLEMDESLRKLPFSDKVFACAQVEKMVEDSTEWLLWLNPDALVFEPPVSVTADEEKWVSVRPVHHKNVGSEFDLPINEFWRRIYFSTGVDTASLWPVVSFVDDRTLRPYYNSGCMAFRPVKGLLREWKDIYCKMLINEEQRYYYSADNNRSIFFHQALLSSVITAKAGRERINLLPPSYSYPLVLQKSDGFANRMDSIPGISIILCGTYENLNSLKIAEPYKSWIDRNALD